MMLFDFLKIPELRSLYEKHPILWALISIGAIALLIIILHFCRKLETQEEKRRATGDGS